MNAHEKDDGVIPYQNHCSSKVDQMYFNIVDQLAIHGEKVQRSETNCKYLKRLSGTLKSPLKAI